MIGHLFIAGAALFALSTGAEPAPASPASPPAVTGSPAANASPKHTEKEYTDHEGNRLRVRLDDGGKVVHAEAKDRGDKPLEVIQIKMQDMSVCIPRSAAPGAKQAKPPKPLCQPLAFLSDGAFFKMGTSSCWCCNVGGAPYCYGSTCH